MSIVNPAVFDPNMTDDEVYNLINMLPVTYGRFSSNTNYFGRLYGVLTGEANEQDWSDFTINHCLRDALWTTLRSVTDEAENFLGYNVSTRYHTREMDFPFDARRRTWPGIEAVDVEPQWNTVTGLNAVAISPFVLLNATVNIVLGKPEVTIPDSLVDNPLNIILRRNSDNGTYSIDDTVKPRKSGSDWIVTLDNDTIAYNIADQVNVQHVKYVFVDIDPETDECDDGELYPVYPGTNQIIPQAKPYEVLGSGFRRYWLYSYSLVNPAFYNNTTNLVNGEFYKLLETIEFRCLTEVESKGLLTKSCVCEDCSDCCCDSGTYQVTTKIVDAANGVVSFCIDGKFDDEGVLVPSECSCLSPDNCHDFKLTFKYKTNPNYLSERLQKAVSQVIRAIVFRTAADLPVIDCGCFLDDGKEKRGFIYYQQEMYGRTSINQLTGTVTNQFRYGDLRGQQAYADIISKVPKHKFALV
jgi:hypothetical protein